MSEAVLGCSEYYFVVRKYGAIGLASKFSGGHTLPASFAGRGGKNDITVSLPNYSIFDSALYRKHTAKWLFPQEKATFSAMAMSTSESKML
jgi:hypothetical protein